MQDLVASSIEFESEQTEAPSCPLRPCFQVCRGTYSVHDPCEKHERSSQEPVFGCLDWATVKISWFNMATFIEEDQLFM